MLLEPISKSLNHILYDICMDVVQWIAIGVITNFSRNFGQKFLSYFPGKVTTPIAICKH